MDKRRETIARRTEIAPDTGLDPLREFFDPERAAFSVNNARPQDDRAAAKTVRHPVTHHLLALSFAARISVRKAVHIDRIDAPRSGGIAIDRNGTEIDEPLHAGTRH